MASRVPVETLTLREVAQRLARLLLAEERARGERTKGVFLLTLTLTNQQIAARVGSVREVVSRALVLLRQDGLIALEDRWLSILDEAALSSYAGED
ncbi:MAG TPA: helix-turn-helix domain-containing protein [Pyrinomonadaceae bacterium]